MQSLCVIIFFGPLIWRWFFTSQKWSNLNHMMTRGPFLESPRNFAGPQSQVYVYAWNFLCEGKFWSYYEYENKTAL